MNICIYVNQNNLIKIEDMLHSISLCNDIKIYLLYSDLKDTELNNITNYINKNNIGKLSTIKIDKFSTQLIPYLIDDNIDKVLYLNSDLICTGNLDELYDTNLDNYVLGAIKDFKDDLINEDVILFNNSLYKEKYSIEDLNNTNINNMISNILILDNKYNYQITKSHDLFCNPLIVNYHSVITPWDPKYDDPNKGRFFLEYLEKVNTNKKEKTKERFINNQKKKKVIISIIVPIYNMEKYLLKCIKSISRQVFEDIEIICINDGSKDSSLSILEECQKIDNRIKIINQENKGLSGARNSGLDIATGEYYGFVDSDDFISPYMYSHLYDCIKKYNVDVAACNHFRVIDEEFYVDKENIMDDVIVYKNKTEMYKEILNDKDIKCYVWSKLYKSDIFKTLRFPVEKIFEDIAICSDIIEASNGMCYTSIPLYFYYNRSDSICNKFDQYELDDAIYNYYERYLFIKDKYKELTNFNTLSMINWMYTHIPCMTGLGGLEGLYNRYDDILLDVAKGYDLGYVDVYKEKELSSETIEFIENFKNFNVSNKEDNINIFNSNKELFDKYFKEKDYDKVKEILDNMKHSYSSYTEYKEYKEDLKKYKNK